MGRICPRHYRRPYFFQQQNGCQGRGNVHFTVPEAHDDELPDSIPEVVNGPIMGVSFAAWLARSPKKRIPNDNDYLSMWWERNFYPDLQMVANDLHRKGNLPDGDYVINIDWQPCSTIDAPAHAPTSQPSDARILGIAKA